MSTLILSWCDELDRFYDGDVCVCVCVCVCWVGGAVHNAVVGIEARTCFDAALRQMFVAGARQTLSSRGYPPLLHLFITACIDVLIELINKNG